MTKLGYLHFANPNGIVDLYNKNHWLLQVNPLINLNIIILQQYVICDIKVEYTYSAMNYFCLKNQILNLIKALDLAPNL